jgi:hypothetical protein
MPKIRWMGLPPALRDHLFERLRERKISAEDLYELKLWRESEPEAPEGAWYKDFGSFKVCGEGEYPRTFLLRGHARPRSEAVIPAAEAADEEEADADQAESRPRTHGCDASTPPRRSQATHSVRRGACAPPL